MRFRRLFQFTLRKLLLAVALIATALAVTPVIWNARPMAPRRIDVLASGELELAGATIYFPVQRDSVGSYYVYDGGTYGVTFIDAKGNRHIVGSWQPFGEPAHHGEIIIGGITPDETEVGRNVGKIPMAERLIFSVMELEDQSYQERPTIMQIAYPRTSDYVGRVLPPRIAYRLGLY